VARRSVTLTLRRPGGGSGNLKSFADATAIRHNKERPDKIRHIKVKLGRAARASKT